MKEKYYLDADVVYRKYNDKTVVYKTGISKVYIMNDICFDILNCFKNPISKDTFLEAISSKGIKDLGPDEELIGFVDQLIEEKILIDKYTLINRKHNLEIALAHGTIIPGNTLQSAMFELTYRCNEKCKHCYCVNADIKKELTTQEVKGLIDQLYDLNAIELTFTGGDLFTRNDSFEIMDYAYKKNFLINIFTNGIALKEDDFYHLKSIHPKSISFSIYNYIPEKHDEFTRVKGSFEKTINAAKKCVALGIPVNIKTSVVESNYNDVDGILNLVESIGATSQISLSITPKNDGDSSNTALRVGNIDKYKNVIRIIKEHISDCEAIKDFDDLIIKDRKICWAGDHSISINPYGEVFACNALLIKCGDARKEKLKDIWENSPKLKEIRSYTINMLKGCEQCENKINCSFCIGNAFSESKDPLKKYSEACDITTAQIELRKEKIENA